MPLFTSNFKYSNKFSIIRVLIFSSLLACCLWFLSGYWFRYTAPIIPERIHDIRSGNLQRAEAITIGNSQSAAIDFEMLGLNYVPLWVGGGDLFEARSLLEAAYKSGARPKWIFITLNPFLLLQDNGQLYNYANFSQVNSLSRDYAYLTLRELSPATLIKGDLIGWLRAQSIPLRAEGQQFFSLKMYAECLAKPTKSCACDKFHTPQEAEPFNLESDSNLKLSLFLSLVIPTLKSNNSIAHETFAELKTIQQMALQHNTRLVLIEAPLADVYIPGMLKGLREADFYNTKRITKQHGKTVSADDISPGYKYVENIFNKASLHYKPVNPFALQKQIMGELAITNPCVIPPGTLWAPEKDGKHEEWFADLIHLNDAGAKIFTKRLNNYLSKTDCKTSNTTK